MQKERVQIIGTILFKQTDNWFYFQKTFYLNGCVLCELELCYLEATEFF